MATALAHHPVRVASGGRPCVPHQPDRRRLGSARGHPPGLRSPIRSSAAELPVEEIERIPPVLALLERAIVRAGER